MQVAGRGFGCHLCNSHFSEQNMLLLLIVEQLLGTPRTTCAPGAYGCYCSSDKSPGCGGSPRVMWGGGGHSWAPCDGRGFGKVASWLQGAKWLSQSSGPDFEDSAFARKQLELQSTVRVRIFMFLSP